MEEKEAKLQPVAAGVPRSQRVTTFSGQLQNSLGFWFVLCLFQGTAWLIWLCYQIIGYFYYYTKPLDTFGKGVPWH